MAEDETTVGDSGNAMPCTFSRTRNNLEDFCVSKKTDFGGAVCALTPNGKSFTPDTNSSPTTKGHTLEVRLPTYRTSSIAVRVA